MTSLQLHKTYHNIVIATVCRTLNIEVNESELDRVSLFNRDQPLTVGIMIVVAWVVWWGNTAGWRGKVASTA